MFKHGEVNARDAMLCALSLLKWCRKCPLLMDTTVATPELSFSAASTPKPEPTDNKEKFDALIGRSLNGKLAAALPGINKAAGEHLAALNIYCVSAQQMLNPQLLYSKFLTITNKIKVYIRPFCKDCIHWVKLKKFSLRYSNKQIRSLIEVLLHIIFVNHITLITRNEFTIVHIPTLFRMHRQRKCSDIIFTSTRIASGFRIGCVNTER